MHKKVLLLILDGWGLSPDPKVSAIENAHTPFIDSLYKKYPNATLLTDGLHVGLPQGQMGNSEVGHMNIGAGRIVYQDLVKINKDIKNNTLKNKKTLIEAFSYAKNNNKAVHFLGLISDGGIHSHNNHLKGLLDIANTYKLPNIFVHAFTDGRDVDPKSGKNFIAEIDKYCKKTNAKLASIIGRYYAMDRDNRWERTKLAYDLLVNGKGTPHKNPTQAIEENYKNDITDEFIKPIILQNEENKPIATIKEDDVVIFFNFRTDRGRQLTKVLTQQNFPEQNMHKLKLHFVTMTNYDDTFSGIKTIYNKEPLHNTLGEVLAHAGKTQIRIAETEKYPHVTFFFNGGREEPFPKEKRILCPSPKVATYDLKPQMSAYQITQAITTEIKKATTDFICLNFANPDMVGHTGNMQAAIAACEVINDCTQNIIAAASTKQYTTIIIADHGNCETMINPDGSPNTAHTINPVPIILVDDDIKHIKSGILANIAPTILRLIGIEQPKEMTQQSLI